MQFQIPIGDISTAIPELLASTAQRADQFRNSQLQMQLADLQQRDNAMRYNANQASQQMAIEREKLGVQQQLGQGELAMRGKQLEENIAERQSEAQLRVQGMLESRQMQNQMLSARMQEITSQRQAQRDLQREGMQQQKDIFEEREKRVTEQTRQANMAKALQTQIAAYDKQANDSLALMKQHSLDIQRLRQLSSNPMTPKSDIFRATLQMRGLESAYGEAKKAYDQSLTLKNQYQQAYLKTPGVDVAVPDIGVMPQAQTSAANINPQSLESMSWGQDLYDQIGQLTKQYEPVPTTP